MNYYWTLTISAELFLSRVSVIHFCKNKNLYSQNEEDISRAYVMSLLRKYA